MLCDLVTLLYLAFQPQLRAMLQASTAVRTDWDPVTVTLTLGDDRDEGKVASYRLNQGPNI